MKICIKCEIEKELDEFPINKKVKSGFEGKCKTCRAAAKKQWHILNKEREKLEMLINRLKELCVLQQKAEQTLSINSTSRNQIPSQYHASYLIEQAI